MDEDDEPDETLIPIHTDSDLDDEQDFYFLIISLHDMDEMEDDLYVSLRILSIFQHNYLPIDKHDERKEVMLLPIVRVWYEQDDEDEEVLY